ncbi:MAG: hypothetical protein PVF47_10140 [Anaerolineae bacterium]|jgi:hypothetical protein
MENTPRLYDTLVAVFFEMYKNLLNRAAMLLLPFRCQVIFLADRGFADTDLMPHATNWNWINHALSKGWDLIARLYPNGAPDPEPAMASRKQHAQRAMPNLKSSFTDYASVIYL